MTGRSTVEAPAREAGALALSSNPYGLSPAEMRAEIIRCIDRGWRGWEIRARFFTREDHNT